MESTDGIYFRRGKALFQGFAKQILCEETGLCTSVLTRRNQDFDESLGSAKVIIFFYNFADVVCYDKIILELKIKHEIDGHDRTQIVNYLKATGCEVGLVINFGNPRYLEWKKYVFTNKKYLKSQSGYSSNNLTENEAEYNNTADIMR